MAATLFPERQLTRIPTVATTKISTVATHQITPCTESKTGMRAMTPRSDWFDANVSLPNFCGSASIEVRNRVVSEGRTSQLRAIADAAVVRETVSARH